MGCYPHGACSITGYLRLYPEIPVCSGVNQPQLNRRMKEVTKEVVYVLTVEDLLGDNLKYETRGVDVLPLFADMLTACPFADPLLDEDEQEFPGQLNSDQARQNRFHLLAFLISIKDKPSLPIGSRHRVTVNDLHFSLKVMEVES